jgi:hypothetical protein
MADDRVTFEVPADYRAELAARADRARFLVIAARRYFSVDGSDVPGSEGFRVAIESLYPLAYTLHFALKRRGVEGPVGALEGLYWVGSMEPIPPDRFRDSADARGAWDWRLQLPVPDAATDDEIAAAIDEVRAKKAPPLLARVRTGAWAEGRVAQVMHVGPYADEPATIARLHEAIEAAGLRPRGCHHEIYIGDPNRSAPEKLRTLLRQPVEAGA